MRNVQYLTVLGVCVVLTLPLEVLLGARVWRRPRRLVRALAPALVIFLAWDFWAAASGQWRFSDSLTTGWNLPFGLPVEEALFFLVVPVCGLLTLEAVRNLSKGRK